MINKLHLIYACIIFCIVILFVSIELFRDPVDKIVIDNFAFASTLISIVLAVVSIVHTISSNSGFQNHISEMKDIEKNLSDSISKIDQMESRLKVTENDIMKLKKASTKNKPQSSSSSDDSL